MSDKERHIEELLISQINAALWECCPPEAVYLIQGADVINQALSQSIEDAAAFAAKDPAAYNNSFHIIQAYTSFKAVLHYRLAHAVDNLRAYPFFDSEQIPVYASLISSRGKLLSGVEIHQKSNIGRRFVLDHGVGTVFGETVQIGDDCYVLGGVTLGAIGISGNAQGKRHPTVGNKVQIGAFSSIFGNVVIGNNVFIGAHCVITEDVPSFSRVTTRIPFRTTSMERYPDVEPIPAMKSSPLITKERVFTSHEI